MLGPIRQRGAAWQQVAARREASAGRFVCTEPKGGLANVGRALGLTGQFQRALHGRQEQADQRANDRDHREQFDQGKGPPTAREAATDRTQGEKI